MKKNRSFWPISRYFVALIGLMLLMSTFTWFVEDKSKLFTIHLLLTLFALAAALLVSEYMRKNLGSFLKHFSASLHPSEKSVLAELPTPVVVLGYRGEIIWYNGRFLTEVLDNVDMLGANIARLEKGFDMESVRTSTAFEACIAGKWFSCAPGACPGAENGRYAVFFDDISELKQTERKYLDSRPTVMVVVFDNEDELLKARESERMRVLSAVEALINSWVSDTASICWADARDKSLIVLEEKEAKTLIENRFTLLDSAKKILTEDGVPVTLSIGVGRGGENIEQCEIWALQALDMALGRGGDQAAVRTEDGYSFFGGVSKSAERQSKVRVRMSAVALLELAQKCDNCIIMGHRYSDLDSLGAAIGIHALLSSVMKEVSIAIDESSSLATSLISYYTKASGIKCFIDPTEALDHVRDNTMLVILDTHSPNFVECRTLYEKIDTVVVIDHHRMMVDHIDNAALFIQEPYASSACEIVAELASYVGEKSIGRSEANALLSGIMLDTKNFVLRTGVRTFEAAAFLRKRGADTVEVKRLFAESLDTYVEKSKLVSAATVYKNCAISSTSERIGNIRIVGSQAADDMLTIKDVHASFVLFEADGQINISARSLGKVNVQIIMEKLGGGGHLTMAGAQLSNTTMAAALEQLRQAIDTARP